MAKINEHMRAGIDFDTLENDSFPQLKMENTLLVQRLFEDLKKSLDVKTSKFSAD
jgi:hypothetical protein